MISIFLNYAGGLTYGVSIKFFGDHTDISMRHKSDSVILVLSLSEKSPLTDPSLKINCFDVTLIFPNYFHSPSFFSPVNKLI